MTAAVSQLSGLTGLLPSGTIHFEARRDIDTQLFAEELAVIARAVPARRAEFATVRHCARLAMAELGLPAVPLIPDRKGAPQWPTGLIGSLTHCPGYRAAAVTRSGQLVSLGIDAEPNEPLPDGVLPLTASAAERRQLDSLGRRDETVHWDRLLFACKESVYKTWYPLMKSWLDFSDAEVALDPNGTFYASVLPPGPMVHGRRRSRIAGRWKVRDTFLLTAAWIDDNG